MCVTVGLIHIKSTSCNGTLHKGVHYLSRAKFDGNQKCTGWLSSACNRPCASTKPGAHQQAQAHQPQQQRQGDSLIGRRLWLGRHLQQEALRRRRDGRQWPQQQEVRHHCLSPHRQLPHRLVSVILRRERHDVPQQQEQCRLIKHTGRQANSRHPQAAHTRRSHRRRSHQPSHQSVPQRALGSVQELYHAECAPLVLKCRVSAMAEQRPYGCSGTCSSSSMQRCCSVGVATGHQGSIEAAESLDKQSLVTAATWCSAQLAVLSSAACSDLHAASALQHKLLRLRDKLLVAQARRHRRVQGIVPDSRSFASCMARLMML